MAKKSRRTRRIADGSLRDTTWQEQEYAKRMGQDALERQERAARLERGQCVCRRRTLKTLGSYRTVHERHCPKYKPWMEEYLLPDNTQGAAHAAAIHGDNVVPITKNTVRREE